MQYTWSEIVWKFSDFFFLFSYWASNESLLNAHLTCCISKVLSFSLGYHCSSIFKVFFRNAMLSVFFLVTKMGLSGALKTNDRSREKKGQRTKEKVQKWIPSFQHIDWECHLKSQIECLFGRKCFPSAFVLKMVFRLGWNTWNSKSNSKCHCILWASVKAIKPMKYQKFHLRLQTKAKVNVSDDYYLQSKRKKEAIRFISVIWFRIYAQ